MHSIDLIMFNLTPCTIETVYSIFAKKNKKISIENNGLYETRFEENIILIFGVCAKRSLVKQ